MLFQSAVKDGQKMDTSMPIQHSIREVEKRSNGAGKSYSEPSKCPRRLQRHLPEIDYNNLPNDHLRTRCTKVVDYKNLPNDHLRTRCTTGKRTKSTKVGSEKKRESNGLSHPKQGAPITSTTSDASDTVANCDTRIDGGSKSVDKLSHYLLKCIKNVVHDDSKIKLIDRPVLLAELSGLTTAEFRDLKEQLTSTVFAIQKASFEYSGNEAVCDCVVGPQKSDEVEVKSEPGVPRPTTESTLQAEKDTQSEDNNLPPPLIKSEPMSDDEEGDKSKAEGRVLVKATFLLDKLLTDKCMNKLASQRTFLGYRTHSDMAVSTFRQRPSKSEDTKDKESDNPSEKTSRKIVRRRHISNHQSHVPYILKRSFASSRQLQSGLDHDPSVKKSVNEESDLPTNATNGYFCRSELRNYSFSDKIELDNKGRINDPYKPIDRRQETPATALTASEILKLKRIDNLKTCTSKKKSSNKDEKGGTLKNHSLNHVDLAKPQLCMALDGNGETARVPQVRNQSPTVDTNEPISQCHSENQQIIVIQGDKAQLLNPVKANNIIYDTPSSGTFVGAKSPLSGNPLIINGLKKILSKSTIDNTITNRQPNKVTILNLDAPRNNEIQRLYTK